MTKIIFLGWTLAPEDFVDLTTVLNGQILRLRNEYFYPIILNFIGYKEEIFKLNGTFSLLFHETAQSIHPFYYSSKSELSSLRSHGWSDKCCAM